MNGELTITMRRIRMGLRHRRLLATGILVTLAGLTFASLASAKPTPEHPFEIQPGSFGVMPSTLQAGAHEDLTTTFDFAHSGSGKTFNDVRNVKVNLPPGFIGSDTAVPACPASLLLSQHGHGSECPPDTQVGTITLDLTIEAVPVKMTFGLYNMEVTNPGVATELGFNALILTQILSVTVRPGDSGLTVTTPNIERIGEPHAVSATVWGIPASPIHDAERGMQCVSFSGPPATCEGGGETVNIPERPYLSTPTSCAPTSASIEAESWEEPGHVSMESAEIEPMEECERVPFSPSTKASPTTNSAESATGLDFTLQVPQSWEKPETIATSHLKDAVVTLPAGMSLNPSAGSGLGSCTEAQFHAEGPVFESGIGCPPESKVGSVEVETPVLTEKAEGALYVARPFDNPFHSLLALYIVARVPFRGVVVKVPCEVHADEMSGQLTTSCLDNPQIPFNSFSLKFRQGATSPLVTPPTCGTYSAAADLTPWSAPLEPREVSSSFSVETGVDGGPCPAGGLPPFEPGLVAGSVNNAAGHYTPFYIRLSRNDGEQEITHFSIKLPPGVTGKLAGIPLCSDAEIAKALSRSHEGMAVQEEADPSCPAASEVGHTIVEAGVGTVLAQAPGKIYLAGPYHGAPVSVVAITDAKVGPFDLGTVVVREALRVNPETGEVFVDATGSDPLPHIIDGIPTHLRDVRIYMNRPEFVLNPTGCEPTSTASTVLGSGKDFVSEADDNPITVSSRFQAADCAALGFKPKLSLQLKGGTKRSQYPALKAVVRGRPGDANIARSEVILPKSEILAQEHIGTSCTRVQFNEGAGNGAGCPANSIYGRARAITPILSEPLEGPVYLRSNGGERKVPDLVAALHGQEINIDLVGFIDSVLTKNKHGETVSRIRNRFESVPDAPVTKFTLEMFGGKKGLLVNSADLCKGTHKAELDFTAHNGKVEELTPAMKTACRKKGKGGKHARR